jgi:hypothetical protein
MMSSRRDQSKNAAAKRLSAIVSIALLCMTASMPAWSQDSDNSDARELTISPENFDKFEAERLRQQRQQYQQQQLRFENERVRQENEHRERDRLQLENERRAREQVRLENERLEQERLRLEIDTRERELAQTIALQQQTEQASPTTGGPDVYEQLRAIGELRDDGILTEQEFQDLKQKILN